MTWTWRPRGGAGNSSDIIDDLQPKACQADEVARRAHDVEAVNAKVGEDLRADAKFAPRRLLRGIRGWRRGLLCQARQHGLLGLVAGQHQQYPAIGFGYAPQRAADRGTEILALHVQQVG